MRRFAAIAARPPVVAVTVAAVISLFGSGVASAAPAGSASAHRTAEVTRVTWHNLRLLHGWKSSRASTYQVANPRYAISGGVVYLDGALHQSSGTNREFAVLPRAARPAHNVFLTMLAGDGGTGAPGSVEIKPNGDMLASGSPAWPDGFRSLLSLSTVSFPAAAAKPKWHNFTLVNGWKSGRSKFGSASPSYAVMGDVTHLAGSVRSGNVDDGLARLPADARPSSVLYITVFTSGGNIGTVVVNPNGWVEAFGTGSTTQTSLDGVSFPTASGKFSWLPLTLRAGWSSAQSAWDTGNPSYVVVGPIVYLAGSLQYSATTGSTAVFASLPSAINPANELVRQVYTYGDTTGSLSLGVGIGTAASDPADQAEMFTSLAGISYPQSS